MKVAIQYFDGCPHWETVDARIREILRSIPGNHVELEYQFIDSPETAERVGFHGSPTILVDGRDPFATGDEPIGMTCRVYRTEEGARGMPTEAQLRRLFTA